MDNIIKGESVCLFCSRKLKRNICSLNSASCQSNSINEKLMSFISPTDYRNVNDSTLFPKPKICNSCVNLVNTIHRNAVKIESLTGTHVNFQLHCESAADGNPDEKWPIIKQCYEWNSNSSKETLKLNEELQSESNVKTNLTGDQTEVATETNIISLSPQTVEQEFEKTSGSGEETDNYYEADELMINDLFRAGGEDHSPSASSQQTWSVTRRSTQYSAQVPKLSLKRVKSDVPNAVHDVNEIVEGNRIAKKLKTQTSRKNQKKREGSTDERKTAALKNETESIAEEKSTLLSDKMISPLKCPYADCEKEFKRSRDLKTHITIHTGEKPFKCNVIGCQKEYRLRNQYTVHMRTHTGERPYKCQYNGCDRAFRRLRSLKLHETTHSNEKPFCCDECGKRFKHSRYFKVHRRSHKKSQEGAIQPLNKSIPCEVCGKMFSSKLSVQRHVNLVHKGIKPEKPPDEAFVCEVNGCNRTFRWKSCMVRHKALKHRQETYKHNGKVIEYTCEVEGCEKVFNRRRFLREHMTSVHGKVTEYGVPKTYKEWLCPDCGMAVIKIQMNRHMDTYHSPDSMFNAKERGEFVCMTECCGMTFDSAEDLRAHVPSHNGNPPYKCQKANCHKTFLLKKNYDVHTMIHDNIKPYQCKVDGCGKGFITQLCLMRHSREHNDGVYICPVETCGAKFRNLNSAGGHLASHRGEDPYVCGLCGAVFSSYNVWSRHKKRHNPEPDRKPIKCPKCSKTFEHKYHLKRHLPTHSDEKPYVCEVCGMSYASRVGYRSHMLTHEEKKYACKFEGCGMKFTLPLTLKRHQAVHENSTRLCSSCGKILKVSLKKHKCAVLKREIGDDKPILSDVQGQDCEQRKDSDQHQLPREMPPLIMPPREFQECDQPSQLHQGQHDHHLQQLHVSQEGQEITPQLIQQHLLHQQQPIQPQQQLHHYHQLQPHQQDRQHNTLLPFQPDVHLSVQQIQPIAMPQESGVPAVADMTGISNACIGGVGPSTDGGTKQPHLINIPASSIQMPGFSVGANSTPNISFPFFPSSASSIPLTSFPASLPSPFPLTHFTSQPTSLPSMHLINDGLPITSATLTAPQENLLATTPFSTTNIPPQSLSHSLSANQIDCDYY